MTGGFFLSPAELATLRQDTVVTVPLPEPQWLPDGALATSALVTTAGGSLRAFANVCRHQPVPLDHDAPSALAPSGCHLMCQHHGALFRPTDGLCVEGPCKGERLFPLHVRADHGTVAVSPTIDPLP